MDGFFAAGLLMPDFEEILAKNKGLNEAFQRFAAEQQAMSAIAGTGEDFVNAISQTWGERALLRLLNNREIRLSFTQRVREIFKDFPKELISYDRWSEAGRLYEEGSVRLDMGEIMNVLAAMMVTLQDVKTPEPVKAVESKVAAPTEVADPEIMEAQKALQELIEKKSKNSGKGFGA